MVDWRDDDDEVGLIHEDDDGNITVENPLPVKHARAMKARERERAAIQLKLAGASYSQIAERLGYSHPNSAYEAVKRAMERLPNPEAETLRRVHHARLEHLLMVQWPEATQGDPKATQTALAIMDRLAKLHGLDAATQHEHHVSGAITQVLVAEGGKDEFIAALRGATGELPSGEILEAEVLEDQEDDLSWEVPRPTPPDLSSDEEGPDTGE